MTNEEMWILAQSYGTIITALCNLEISNLERDDKKLYETDLKLLAILHNDSLNRIRKSK